MVLVPVNRRALGRNGDMHPSYPSSFFSILVVGCGMQAFQQLCGFNTLMYYSATLFKEIGFDQPTAVGLIVSGTNFIFTLIALKYIDIVGRRKIMIISAPGMIFGLTLASIAFHCKQRLRIPWCLLRLHYSLQSLLKKPAVTWWMAPNIRPLGLLSSSYP